MQNKKLLLILLITLLGIQGCKVKERTESSSTTAIPARESSLLKEIQQAEPDFRTINIKRMSVSADFISQLGKMSSAAGCQVIRDSVIFISVKPFLGIEMFVARLTPQEIVVVDKVRNVVYQTDYEIFEDFLDLDINYKTCEQLLTNKLFTIQSGSSKKAVAKSSIIKNQQAISFNDPVLSQQFILNPQKRIKEVEIKSAERPEIFQAAYADFTNSNEVLFPSDIKFKLDRKSKNYNLALSISQIEFDKAVNIPYLNLNLYKKGDIRSLIK